MSRSNGWLPDHKASTSHFGGFAILLPPFPLISGVLLKGYPLQGESSIGEGMGAKPLSPEPPYPGEPKSEVLVSFTI